MAFERFRNYIGDMNVVKEPYFFVDMLTRNYSWLGGLNILIIEQKFGKENRFYLHHNDSRDDNLDIGVIYLHRGIRTR